MWPGPSRRVGPSAWYRARGDDRRADGLQQHESIGDRVPRSRQNKDQVPRIQALRRGLLVLVLLLALGGVFLILRYAGTVRARVSPLPSPSQHTSGPPPSQGPDSPSQTPSPATTTSGPTRSLGSAGSMPAGGDAKRACFYGSVSVMQHVGHQVGQTFDCALVFNDATPNWTGWQHPWFIGYYKPDFNWAAWATAVPGRQLVITQRMIPDNPPSDWRQRGANGGYEPHAPELARTPVAAGPRNS